ncbi:MAG: ATP-grasp domain-containing protein [Deltaproteobacteria bacterium]|nr:ATP-grasp domain-containing protein [Deltaproteobacteria bacterium]
MFKKVLIANRGEIALRVAKTLKRLRIPSVALYLQQEADALHVQFADEASLLDGESLSETYLDIELMISLAKKQGCDAIHPGYGFLSENPLFSEACRKNQIRFIGPSPEAMRKVGNKLSSRKLAEKVGVPVVPYAEIPDDGVLSSADQKRIGFPLMIKAAAGGGGKGLKRVDSPKELKEAVESARREAKSAFGNPRIYAEKYLEKVRHIEIQIMGDRHGNILSLGERECSSQRRHQKIIEESPSPFVDEALRKKLSHAARQIAEEAHYENAGTVEFLVDREKEFYFLEVNARLQVEHSVTEMRTGLDLVELQLKAAAGECLPIRQEEIPFRGHAIEARINAENPEQGFLPESGRVIALHFPSLEHLRIDTALTTQSEVTPAFDPLLCKMITWGEGRETARKRLLEALSETILLGVGSNLDFLKFILASPPFIRGEIYTSTIEELIRGKGKNLSEIESLLAVTAAWLASRESRRGGPKESLTPWTRLGPWRL